MAEKDFLFGLRPLIEAVNAGKNIDKVLLKTGLQGNTFNELYGLLKKYKIPFQFVPVEKLNRYTRKNHQGVIALMSFSEVVDIETLVPGIYDEGKQPFILILDRITDVRNFGAIVRSAECAGVDAILIPAKGAARINSDAMKTSAGALNNMNICRTDSIKNTIRFLKDSGIKIYGASEKAETNYFTAELNQPVAIVMGSEDEGISKNILESCDELIKIPIEGKTGSLNVSAAATVLLFEVTKQRSV